MKRFITVISLLLLSVVLCVTLCACGEMKNNENGTTLPENTSESEVLSDTTMFNKENGEVTDTPEKGNNGAVGDVVTDVSEKLSEAVTDASEAVSR